MKRNFVIVLGMMLVGYATPVALRAQTTLERLEEQIRQRVATSGREMTGRVSRPSEDRAEPRQAGGLGYLGLMADDGKDRGRGVRILDVQQGSPAEKSGLRKQDLITAIAAVRVRQISDMTEVLGTFGPGQTVDFDILREGKPQKLHVVLGQHPTGVERQAALPSGDLPEAVPRPVGEPIPEPPGPQLAEPTLAPAKGSEPVISTTARLDQLERRLDGLERRISDIEKSLKKRNKD